MKMRKILCVLLSICAAAAVQTAAAETAGTVSRTETAELAEAGTYGNTIHWQLEDGVLTISPEAESDKAIAMPAGKKREDYDWSAYAEQITKVVISGKVSSVGDYAFQGCEKLESVELSDSVTTIGKFSFAGCTGAVSLSLGPSVGTVNASAFQGCTKLEALTLTGTLGTLDGAMLEGCAALKSVTLAGTEAAPLALKAGTAFRNCPSLEKITISGPFASLGANLFALYDKDGSAADAKGSFIKNSTEYLPTALSEADLSGLEFSGKTTALPSGLFTGCTALSTVKLPAAGMTEIGAYDFAGCAALASIDLPAGLATIGDNAFQGCPLKTLTLPNGVLTVGKNTFENCSSLASVNFPAGLNGVGDYAFKNCDVLESVKFPRTSEKFTLGQEAFAGCDALASASLHLIRNSKFAMPTGAFQDCPLLSSLTLPENLTAVGDSAFQACTSLESVTFPKNVKTIGKRAFSECTGLRHFDVLGSGVTLGEEVFSSCTAMTAAVIPEGVQTIDEHAFQYCDGIKNAVLPGTVTTVSAEIFFRCGNLEHVYYPGGETEWKAIKNSDKLQENLSSRNFVNGSETLVLEWDKETTPISDGYSSGEGGGGTGTGEEEPLNPGDPANAYGKNLPAKISSASLSADGVKAKVLGTPGDSAVLLAAVFGSEGKIIGTKSVTVVGAGTYTAGVSTENAAYVSLFLLKDNAPVAEKFSLFLQ